MNADALAQALRTALLPLAVVPAGPPANLDEVRDLLPPGPPRPAAVLVAIAPQAAGAQVWLTRRVDGLRHHAGQVSFPGGAAEPDDRDPVATALREAQEEIRLPPSLAEPLGYLDPLLTLTGFRVQPVVALVDSGFVPQPDPDEVAEVFALDLRWLLDPANVEQIALDFAGRTRHVLQYRYAPQRIWGATAAILDDLRRRLAGRPLPP